MEESPYFDESNKEKVPETPEDNGRLKSILRAPSIRDIKKVPENEMASNKVHPERKFGETSNKNELMEYKPTDNATRYIKSKRKSVMKRASFYRRPSVIVRRAVESGADAALMSRIRQASANGLVHNRTVAGLAAFVTSGDAVDDPFTVGKYPISYQLAFRKKIFGILTFEMLLTTVITFLFSRFSSIKDILTGYINFVVWAGLALTFLSLAVLYIAKYNYPANYISLVIFVLCKSASMAITGWYFDTYIGLIVFGSLTFFSLLVTITSSIVFDANSPEELIIPVYQSVIASWLLNSLAITALFFSNYIHDLTLPRFGFIIALLTVFGMWFAADATAMMKKMAIDEFMQGVIFFYTDLIIILILLVIVGFLIFGNEWFQECCGTLGDGGGEMAGAGAGVAADAEGTIIVGVTPIPVDPVYTDDEEVRRTAVEKRYTQVDNYIKDAKTNPDKYFARMPPIQMFIPDDDDDDDDDDDE